MSQKITLTAADNHDLDAWRSAPDARVKGGKAKGGIVLLHAIYGLTTHMGDVCDSFAAQGYAAIAPALYDRGTKNRVYGYDADGREGGRQCYGALSREVILADVEAAAEALRQAGPVIISGFCSGGTWAWISAAELNFDAAVIFYGSHVPARLDYTPRCPTIMHYGDIDATVPMADFDAIRQAHPGLTYHIYPGAQHAFFNPEQDSYDTEAAALAFSRSINFMDRQFATA